MGRGAILIAFIVCYSLTSIVCGYTSGSLYARSGGRNWIPTMLYAASMFPLFCFSVMFVLNVVALLYKSLGEPNTQSGLRTPSMSSARYTSRAHTPSLHPSCPASPPLLS